MKKEDFDQEYFFQFHYGLEPVILKNQIPEFPEVKFFLFLTKLNQDFDFAKKKQRKHRSKLRKKCKALWQ